YRVRAVASGAGSAWVTVAPHARSATLTLHPAADLRILVTDGERRELEAAPPVALAAVFEADGHVPLALSGPLPDLPRSVVLAPGATIRGRFVDRRKAPVGGVEVTAEW